jgi:preprotein translocase subunit SecA
LIGKTLAKVFGTSNEREVKRMRPLVEEINGLEPKMEQLTDEQLRAKTAEFRARIQERTKEAENEITRLMAEMKSAPDQDVRGQIEEWTKRRMEARNQALDEILPEAFAVAREGGRRVLNMRHFDVQLIGGMVLHQGKIAEMKTGEGKTLVATLPVYLNALTGDGVHVVTVNDYLAKRDSEWMGKLYRFLGLSVGVIVHDLDDDERREAYAADVTYGTNNEFGFDYLRDNMKFDLAECVQRGHNFGIVDEVDSILIDEARTPLIISGQSDESTDKYDKANRVVPHLVKGEEIEKPPGEPKEYTGDFVVDEKHKNTMITDEGWDKVERLLGIENISDPENWAMKHHVETAVKAHAMYRKDVEYVVKDGEVLIVDEFTGRLMPGRRWSDGLHQAIEAKEGVKVERETQTLATITFQNYFRMYKKLAGMTGTAETEASEFDSIYRLQVVVIPTNRVLLRKENPDVVYRTEKEKYYAVADEIQKIAVEGRPVLVGTTSIEKSERISDLLKKKNVKHVVLNAKFHEKEAEIVAQAGRMNQVTIATNMAGRGTDILLGGNAEFMGRQEMVKKGIAQQLRVAAGEVALDQDTSENIVFYYNGQEYKCPADKWNDTFNKYKKETDAEHEKVVSVGGLHILGTERHEARRIDNQLRGRAGRQGDPGSSRFYLSLEDDLMRIFAKQWVSTLLQRLGMEEGVPIESRMISKRIEAAQKAVEAQNFESRKHVLEYDDVMNKQRVAVYGLRKELLSGIDQKDLILEDYVASMVSEALDKFAPRNVHADQWDIEGLNKYLIEQFGLEMEKQGIDAGQLNRQELGDQIFEKLKDLYDAKEKQIGADAMRYHERMIMLSVLDTQWKDHLLSMDHLKEGIGLRGYGQHDPLVEYKRESFDMFEEMMEKSQQDAVRYLFHMQIMEAPTAQPAVAASEENGDEPLQQLPPPRKRASTSMDDLEAQFQRRKKRELEQARMAGSNGNTAPQQVVRGQAKVGRNDPCPCGSGKKYKKCHGAGATA